MSLIRQSWTLDSISALPEIFGHKCSKNSADCCRSVAVDGSCCSRRSCSSSLYRRPVGWGSSVYIGTGSGSRRPQQLVNLANGVKMWMTKFAHWTIQERMDSRKQSVSTNRWYWISRIHAWSVPMPPCDSYGSLIPHDLEKLVVDDLILSKTWCSKPIMVQWGLSSSVSTCAAKFVGTDFHYFNDPSPPGVSDLVALLNRVLSLLSVYPLFSILPGSFLSENRWFSSITHFSLFIGKCLHSSFINSSLCLLQMRAL